MLKVKGSLLEETSVWELSISTIFNISEIEKVTDCLTLWYLVSWKESDLSVNLF